MNVRRGRLFIVTSALALLLIVFAGAALAQETTPNTATPSGPTIASETTGGNWLIVAPDSGVTGNVVTVGVSVLSLGQGTFTGVLTVSRETHYGLEFAAG